MYRQYHPLAYDSGKGEKLIGSLSAYETMWWGMGLYASYKMAQWVPPLPINNTVFGCAHYFIPLAVCLFVAYAKHGKTGMTLFRYLLSYLSFLTRPRKLMYRRKDNA